MQELRDEEGGGLIILGGRIIRTLQYKRTYKIMLLAYITFCGI